MNKPDPEVLAAAAKDIEDLGHSPEKAKEMVLSFVEDGGLASCLRWPEAFSMCSPKYNVVDVLLKHGLF